MSAPRGKPPLPVTVNQRGYTIFGRKYPRVTSIVGLLPKPALVGWAAKSVAEFAVAHRSTWEALPADDAVKLLKGAPWSQRDAAADRGTAIHKVIDSYVKGAPLPDCTEEELEVAIAAERFLLDHKPEIHGTEITVYSPSMEYAGTCDMWCTIFGERWLLDWKTGKGVYPEYAVQLAAYALAERAIMKGDDVEWPDLLGHVATMRLGVVHLTPKSYTLYEVQQPLVELAAVFAALRRIGKWCATQDDALTVSSAILPRETVSA